jgi:hypothetical protein
MLSCCCGLPRIQQWLGACYGRCTVLHMQPMYISDPGDHQVRRARLWSGIPHMAEKAENQGLPDLPQPVLAQILQATSEVSAKREQKRQFLLPLAREYRDSVLASTKRASLRLGPVPGDVAAASRLLSRLCTQCQPGLDLSIFMPRQASDLDQLFTSAPQTGWEKVQNLHLYVSTLS